MKTIQLTNGVVCLVDDDDLYLLSRHSWYINHAGYARTCINGKFIFMHHLIMGTLEPRRVVDHVNRNPLDNRKENLRFVNKSQNGLNTKKTTRNKTGFKGVRMLPSGRYTAYTGFYGKQITFGTFTKLEDAAKARDAGIENLHPNEIFTRNFEKV